ncbi:MAG: heme o synthase [Rubritalea sp.]|uniref:heme o synthase n=1 Tax=Rubritalea sp. TaxID=2109375 RepID=UPI00324256AE
MSEQPTKLVEKSEAVSMRQDLMVLTKVRLNVFVLVTTLFGFILASKSQTGAFTWGMVNWWLLFHTLLGTAAAAFGAAAFNQLMEIEQDRTMDRTKNRPLPSQRMSVTSAFIIGWGLSAFGVIHLGNMVNAEAAYIAAATIGIYVFAYTPMKRQHSANTLVGAIPGATPPMIGWAAAGCSWYAMESWYLFALLFLWQLPHFVAINWFCREQYEEAGYKMWSNGDVSGKKTARLALIYSAMLTLLAPLACLPGLGMAGWAFGVGGFLAGAYMCKLSVDFGRIGDRKSSRKLFFFTLLYLPLALILLTISWN